MNHKSIMYIRQLFIFSEKKILVGEICGRINREKMGKIYKNNIFVQDITIVGEQMIKKTTPNAYHSLEVDGFLLFSNKDLSKDNWVLIVQ